MEKLLQIHSQQVQRKKKTVADMRSWLESSGEGLAGRFLTLADAGSVVAGVTLGIVKAVPEAIELLSRLSKLMRDQSDDYIGMNRAELFYTKKEGNYVARWLMNDGLELPMKSLNEKYYSHEKKRHSTVTLVARLRGWSTSVPSRSAMW